MLTFPNTRQPSPTSARSSSDSPVPTIRLVCGCCGHAEEFESQDAAFDEGWDTPLRFGYTACSLCPGVGVYLPHYLSQQAREEDSAERRASLLAEAAAWSHSHDRAHGRWATEGRPNSFEASVRLGDVEMPPRRDSGARSEEP